MDGNCLVRLNMKSSSLCTSGQWKSFMKCKPQHPSMVAMLRRPSSINITREATKTNTYKDNLFDRLAINHLSKSVQAATGLSNNKSGYESLVEAATVAKLKFNPIQQQEVVIQALHRAFPKPILSLIKTLLPPSKLSREYFAAFTTLFFAWLVGPSEVRESEVNGRREKNVVYVRKCRFLEETNCVGMCINLCKMPSQSFIKDSLGVPVNMVPNFDDMSCEMIFGQDPPASTDDPALKQPCYKLCKAYKSHTTNCLS
ncbi:hypothetical protein RJT34_20049 [Clitoria ternatea]|uniref:Beta-carotene isomerase D27-like C-terminal domain-containing protein n=1 Tax=Clitoria ternatea TaxID=43366 RepID=A0AAN9ISA8_CLITE